MAWSHYLYLAPTLVAALALLAFCARVAPRLCAPSSRPSRLELGVLAAITLLGLVTLYGSFYLGQSMFAYADVGSDTMEQYVPYYLNMLESIKSGTLGAWNFQYGLGTSFMSYQSWTLDPFNLVLVPLGLALGSNRLALVLVIVQSLKVALSAFVADYLLSFYCKTPLARILGSSLLAFGGYLVLWGQHYWIGSIYVMTLVLMLALELLADRWGVTRFLAVCVATAVCVVMSTYSGFMILLFCAIYAALRCAHLAGAEPSRGFVRRFGALAAPVVCGLLVSLVTLVPYATLMLGESTRVTGTGSASLAHRLLTWLTSFVPLRWLPFIASRLLGSSLVTSGEPIPAELVPATAQFPYVNVYEVITLGLSAASLALLVLFAWWVATRASRRDKVLIGVAAALCVLYCCNFFLPTLFNALVNPKYRSSFAVAIPACLAMAVAFERVVLARRAPTGIVALALAAPALVVVWSLAHTVNGRLVCLAYLAALAGMVAVLALMRRGASENDLASAKPGFAGEQGAVATAPGASLSSEQGNTAAGSARKGRHMAPLAGSHAYAAPDAPAMLSPRVCTLACVFCFLTIATSLADGFFTTNNRGVCAAANFPAASQDAGAQDTEDALAYLREHDSSMWRVEKLYADWTSLDDSLVQGYRGVASYNSTLDSDIEEFYTQLWPTALMGDVAYQSFSADPNHAELLTTLGVKYLLSRTELDWPYLALETQCGSVYVYRNINVTSLVTLKAGIVSEADANQCTDAAQRRELMAASQIVSADAPGAGGGDGTGPAALMSTEQASEAWRAYVSKVPAGELAETLPFGGDVAAALDANTGYVPASSAWVRQTSGSSLGGGLFSAGTTYGCLAVPYTSGWEVTIDGAPVETFRANYGFIGFVCPAGAHSIEAHFSPKGLKVGLVGCGAGVVLAAVGCVVGHKLRRRKA